MKNTIKNKTMEIFISNKWWILFDIAIFSFICGKNVPYLESLNINLSEFILVLFVDHYYILYLYLPIIFIFSLKELRKIETIELIRYKNLYQFTLSNYISFLSFLVLYTLMHILIALIIGFPKFNLSCSFSNFTINGYDEILQLLLLYKNNFFNAIISIFFVSLYLISGTLFIYIILLSVCQKLGYKYSILLSILIFLSSFVGFKTNLSEIFPIVSINNYLILHHSLFVNGILKFFIVLFTNIFVKLILLGITKKNKKTTYLNKLLLDKKVLLSFLISITILIILELCQKIYSNNFNINDLLPSLFWGSSSAEPYFIGWLKITIIYFIPIFIIGALISKFKQNKNTPLLIRFNNKNELEWYHNLLYLKITTIYSIFLNIILLPTFLFTSKGMYTEFIYETTKLNTKNFILLFCSLFILNSIFILSVYLLLCKLFNESLSFVFMLLISYLWFLIFKSTSIFSGISLCSMIEEINSNNFVFQIVIMIIFIIIYYTYLYKNRRIKNDKNN